MVLSSDIQDLIMTTTFFWHDYETFGATPKSDRPAQFAGIRTDMDLNEIGDPFMFYCKPTLDALLPSLEACLITGITPSHCEKQGITEREFAISIERELASPGTIGVGYNSIRFDDEVTRFLFWRNLLDPYAREWQNNCGRWDLLDVVRGLYALFPESLSWPQSEEGAISFKLTQLSQANGLLHENAHDALSDVRATLDLARLIKKAQPKFFDFCLNLRKKDFVRTQLSLNVKRPLLHVSGMYGIERSCLAIVWPLAEHPTNKNEIIVWDLATDPTILLDLDAKEIKTRLFTRSDELSNNNLRLPIKTISVNKSPFVMHDLRVLTPERIVRLNIDLAIIDKHAEIAKNLTLAPNLWQHVYVRDKFDSLDVDEDLYGGFVPDHDRYLLNRLRTLDADKLTLEDPSFTDKRLNELFFRYRARNFPGILNAEDQAYWQTFCANKLNPRLPTFWKEFYILEQTATEAQRVILMDIKSWVECYYNKL
jgi:exodeoxyribonuclease-1